jgi:glucose uptake protein
MASSADRLSPICNKQRKQYLQCFTWWDYLQCCNILLSSAISLAGMAVAFPVGIGTALILGVLINYIAAMQGNPSLLFAGVACIAVAIVINAFAYKRMMKISRNFPRKEFFLACSQGC